MISPDVLTASINNHGLHFVVGGISSDEPLPRLSPAAILAGLSEQSDARLRMAIIALLLYRPDLAAFIPTAIGMLDGAGQQALKLFCTAAVLLQQIHDERLKRLIPQWQVLPDYFSQELNLPQTGSPQDRLFSLSLIHRRLSGLAANWMGTYQYAAERLMIGLEKEVSWKT